MAKTIQGTNNGYTGVLTLTPGTPNIEQNTTVISYTLVLKSGSNHFADWSVGYSVFIDGKQAVYQPNANNKKVLGANSSLTLYSGKVTVTHNPDGTKKAMAVSFKIWTETSASYLPGTVQGAGTMDLTTIPRASALSLSSTDITLNTDAVNVTASVAAASAAFSHKIKYTFGSASAEISLAAGIKTGTLRFPMDLLKEIPSSVSGAASVVLTTYSGAAVVGSKTASITIRAGASIVPTISKFTATRVGQTDLPMYIQGYSKARLQTTAAGAYGSTIRTYAITGGLSGADVTTGTLYTAGKNTWTVVVTDSRGRTASASVSVDVVAYTRPKISGVAFERCTANGTPDDDGTYLSVFANITISPCNGANSYTAKVQRKPHSEEYWQGSDRYVSGQAGLYNVLTDDTYDVRLVVTDKLSTVDASDTLDTGVVLVEYHTAEDVLELKRRTYIPSAFVEAGAVKPQTNYFSTVDINHVYRFGGFALITFRGLVAANIVSGAQPLELPFRIHEFAAIADVGDRYAGTERKLVWAGEGANGISTGAITAGKWLHINLMVAAAD